MSKIRRFEVTNEDGFDFTVDGQPTVGDGATTIIKAMNDYQNELDSVDGTIEIIMRSLRTTHNLSDDEYAEYKQTLKYILKD